MASKGGTLFRPLAARASRSLKIANYWTIAQLSLGLLKTIRLLPADKALDFLDNAARRLGPLMGRHRTALSNLRAAYPDKPDAELEAIARDMWGNMARLAGEYVFTEQLMRRDPGARLPANVEIVGEDLFVRLCEEKGPHILFTGHVGNFELLPIVAAAYGLKVTALFRAPNNPFLAAELLEKRTETMGELVASGRGSAFQLARVLEANGNIGVLVDQKFRHGLPGTFFDRPCETSPLLAKLARQFDCPVHPARCIRLPGNRFRLELREKLDLPRTPNGAVDVAATTQLLNDIVEGWVREYPGQWMWFHKRWKLTGTKRRPGAKSTPASGA